MAESLESSDQLTMQKKYSLNTTQSKAVDYCLEHDSVLLIADKGAGKTRTGLAVAHASGGRVLILCPNKVRAGWVKEGVKLGIDVRAIEGSEAVRKAMIDGRGRPVSKHAIYVMGVDLIKWLVDTYGAQIPFDGLILDETTRYSSPGSVGVKRLRRVREHIEWTLGLTASPVMEKPIAIYGQALVLDGGKTLGRRFDDFKQTYLFPTDYQQRNWELQPHAGERLAVALAPLVYYMEDTAYADSLVPLEEVRVEVNAWTKAFDVAYRDMCETALMEINGVEVEAANEAVVSGKLEQLCEGAVLDANGVAHWIHYHKFDTLEQILDQEEPTIVVYQFKFELEELRQRYPWGVDLKDPQALERFNAGDTNLLFMHPKSGSHGINAQERCCEMIMMKPIWSADGTDQVVGRIRRRGQTRPCRRRTLYIPGTVDELILDRVAGKAQDGGALLNHIRAKARK